MKNRYLSVGRILLPCSVIDGEGRELRAGSTADLRGVTAALGACCGQGVPMGKPQTGCPVRIWGGPASNCWELVAERCQQRRPVAHDRDSAGSAALTPALEHHTAWGALGTHTALRIIHPPSCVPTQPHADVHTRPQMCPAPPRAAVSMQPLHSPGTAWGQPPPKGQGMLLTLMHGSRAEAVL